MLRQHNVFELISILSSIALFTISGVHYFTGFLGVWIPFYAATIFTCSVFVSFRCLRKLLDLNAPIKYEDVFRDYRFVLARVSAVKKDLLPKNLEKNEYKEYDTSELSVISSVLERKLVWSWYSEFVSKDIVFPFACKELLDHSIGRAFSITHKVDPASLYIDVSSILSSHLNEYKRASKLQHLSNGDSFVTFYRLSHPAFSDEEKKIQNYCTDVLRIALKNVIPFDLWDSPHTELLIRILSKSLYKFINVSLSNPKWLYKKIYDILSESKFESQSSERNCDILENVTTPSVNSVVQNVKEAENTQEMEEGDKLVDVAKENEPSVVEDMVEITAAPVLRQRRGRQGKNEIKIYNRIIEGKEETWMDPEDLRCVSVGQDLLENMDVELSALWENEGPWVDRSPHALWFGEEELFESEESPRSHVRDKSFNLPRLDLNIHATVDHAKHTISDLQDEAAGVMEGILDMGLTGLKKGLKLTGLHDNIQDKFPLTPSRDKPWNGRRTPHGSKSNGESESPGSGNGSEEDVHTNPSHLVKQRRVTSQDSVPVSVPGRERSPEPEYEEPQDLASSIAKLRSLLSQRDAKSNEDIWETIEETKGRTSENHAGRRIDSAVLADEYDVNAEAQTHEQTGNNIQRLDRLLTRTVTGVLNSIRTAVGAEGEGETIHATEWRYVCTAHDLGVGSAVPHLLAARRARAVDAALDSLQLAGAGSAATPPPTPRPLDLDEWRSTRGGCWSVTSDLLAPWRSHFSDTIITVLLGEIGEEVLRSWLSESGPRLREAVFASFRRISEVGDGEEGEGGEDRPEPRAIAELVLSKLPGCLYLFGESTLRDGVTTFLLSLSSERINKNLIYRLIDVLLLHFVKAAKQ